MRIVYKKNQRKVYFEAFIFITLFITISFAQYYNFLGSQDRENNFRKNREIIISQGPSNDTTAPIIIFKQPSMNGTIITQYSYTIKANISDDNPPLFGNVTFQISNYTTFLFNASMTHDGENQWSYIWNNISLYPNRFYRIYIIQIWAKDSSSNENIGISEEFYIYLNLPAQTPGVINLIIYLIVISLILAGTIVFINRKLLHKVSDKKK